MASVFIFLIKSVTPKNAPFAYVLILILSLVELKKNVLEYWDHSRLVVIPNKTSSLMVSNKNFRLEIIHTKYFEDFPDEILFQWAFITSLSFLGLFHSQKLKKISLWFETSQNLGFELFSQNLWRDFAAAWKGKFPGRKNLLFSKLSRILVSKNSGWVVSKSENTVWLFNCCQKKKSPGSSRLSLKTKIFRQLDDFFYLCEMKKCLASRQSWIFYELVEFLKIYHNYRKIITIIKISRGFEVSDHFKSILIAINTYKERPKRENWSNFFNPSAVGIRNLK